MTWTYASLKAADAALGIADLTAAAAALNAQTKTLTGQTFTWAQAKAIAREAATGDWSKIVARSRMALTGTAADVAILEAINAAEAEDGDVFNPNAGASWTAFQSGLSALQTAGDLAASTVAAINALTTVTQPAWQPAVTAGDIQTARAQP